MSSTETLVFDDNALMSALAGPHDANLLLIENALGVRLDARGNEVTLRGAEGARYQAREALRSLYARLEKGEPIAAADVEGALRLSAGGEATNGAASAPSLVLPRRTIAPRSAAQADYMRKLSQNELVFGVGPAGTGKTYLAVANAAAAFLRGEVERLILSRPAVEAGERIGFLPGDMKEKVDPYLRPLYDALYDVMHTDHVDRRIAAGEIEIAPLAFMRGRTLSRAVVILDEAQNATIGQMKMFLTRLGEGSRMVITGDPSQTDLPDARQSGLQDALSLVPGIQGVAVTRFSGEDVVRHRLVGEIVRAYDARERARMEKAQEQAKK
ncbi:PhoH family protein [Parvularcula dongshanensis]|uniref:PhoH-like protein n=1 Tax=Parvularcula dongshanensis TaxID=1173995 RepID=A0A840I1D4_9PROT|nr:PhoH family protein [Parvularcula dongshanensis]MBB4658008.1 phosphate starvation-inducible PhoH-like protein [Parvularcula dongshanensis]